MIELLTLKQWCSPWSRTMHKKGGAVGRLRGTGGKHWLAYVGFLFGMQGLKVLQPLLLHFKRQIESNLKERRLQCRWSNWRLQGAVQSQSFKLLISALLVALCFASVCKMANPFFYRRYVDGRSHHGAFVLLYEWRGSRNNSVTYQKWRLKYLPCFLTWQVIVSMHAFPGSLCYIGNMMLTCRWQGSLSHVCSDVFFCRVHSWQGLYRWASCTV